MGHNNRVVGTKIRFYLCHEGRVVIYPKGAVRDIQAEQEVRLEPSQRHALKVGLDEGDELIAFPDAEGDRGRAG